ncbi:hypothetical protein KIPB_002526 [Kipferlia bialata]|uniref:Uncharacterized protein n=1 Tax=Kipferlia bialata TaxID=797122 RepID=A0A9K3CSX2_9EUKA|nr:hypothetical protein KIPB_002526 [Kipferlia bialata]|eukprot:g2526.t1
MMIDRGRILHRERARLPTTPVRRVLSFLIGQHAYLLAIVLGTLSGVVLSAMLPLFVSGTGEVSPYYAVLVVLVYCWFPYSLSVARTWAHGTGPDGQAGMAAYLATLCMCAVLAGVQQEYVLLSDYGMVLLSAFLAIPACTIWAHALVFGLVQSALKPVLKRRIHIPSFAYPEAAVSAQMAFGLVIGVLMMAQNPVSSLYVWVIPPLSLLGHRIVFMVVGGWGLVGSPTSVQARSHLLTVAASYVAICTLLVMGTVPGHYLGEGEAALWQYVRTLLMESGGSSPPGAFLASVLGNKSLSGTLVLVCMLLVVYETWQMSQARRGAHMLSHTVQAEMDRVSLYGRIKQQAPRRPAAFSLGTNRGSRSDSTTYTTTANQSASQIRLLVAKHPNNIRRLERHGTSRTYLGGAAKPPIPAFPRPRHGKARKSRRHSALPQKTRRMSVLSTVSSVDNQQDREG